MKVLVAVEDESCLAALIGFIRSLPWSADTQFKVVHVVRPALVGSFMSVLPGPILEGITKERWRVGEQLVEATRNQLNTIFSNAAIEHEIVEGHPKTELMAQIEEWKPELAIIGAHRRTRTEDLILGNVASAIVSQATCSVVVVPIRDGKKQKGEAHQTEDKTSKKDDGEGHLHIIV